MHGGDVRAAFVGNEDGLAVCRFNEQAKAGTRCGHTVAFCRNGSFAGHGLRLKNKTVAVHLHQLGPGGHALRAQIFQHAAAVGNDVFGVILHGKSNVAAAKFAKAHASGAGLKGATHLRNTGKNKGDITYSHSIRSSVHI